MSTRTIARPSRRRDRSAARASTSGSSGTRPTVSPVTHAARASLEWTCVHSPGSAGAALAVALVPALSPAVSQAASQGTAVTRPGSPAYVARDAQNIRDAYGRVIGPGGQLSNPAYLTSLTLAGTADQTSQLMEQAASPTRVAVTPGRVVPGWNVGNPLRMGWNGTRGLSPGSPSPTGTAPCCTAPSTGRSRARATRTPAPSSRRPSPAS